MERQRIVIDRDWRGEDARPGERVALELRATPHALELHIEAPYHGDPPPPGPVGHCDGLWEYEVVEVFLLAPPDRYLEVELSPHGHFLTLQLHGLRQPIASDHDSDIGARGHSAIDFTARIERARWRGVASVPWREVPPGTRLVNAYAIHGCGDARRYLAWQPVPGETPDFHRLDCFAELAPALRPTPSRTTC